MTRSRETARLPPLYPTCVPEHSTLQLDLQSVLAFGSIMTAPNLQHQVARIARMTTQSKRNNVVQLESVSPGDAQHELQDLQSLMLHKEAVHLLKKKKPELIQQVFDTLERWRSAGDSHSRFLWDEWSVILHRRARRRALSLTRRSKELRQASPLATILPAEVRQQVLEQVQQLKRGVTFGKVVRPASRRPSPKRRLHGQHQSALCGGTERKNQCRAIARKPRAGAGWR